VIAILVGGVIATWFYLNRQGTERYKRKMSILEEELTIQHRSRANTAARSRANTGTELPQGNRSRTVTPIGRNLPAMTITSKELAALGPKDHSAIKFSDDHPLEKTEESKEKSKEKSESSTEEESSSEESKEEQKLPKEEQKLPKEEQKEDQMEITETLLN